MTIISADEFARLRTSEDPVEYGRAAREDAPIEVWLEVIARYPDLRKWVAHNKRVPIEILEQLSRDGGPRVRFTVASKRKATESILARVAEDADESVRLEVVRHRNTPPALMRRLADDEWEAVRELARSRLEG
jgi:hypothetical protein